jgi:catechol-2,3-dioxygenase
MPSPVKLSHLVLQTNQIAAMRDWYIKVLDAELVQESDFISFISYDEEHHRIAFLNPGPLARKGEADVGFNHVAFSFASLKDLLGVYEKLKREGIVPNWCINHGPTTSLYYKDPDGNGVEIEVDNFPNVADCKAYMRSPAFINNQRGIEFDPDDMLRRLRSGVPERELLDRANLEKAPA